MSTDCPVCLGVAAGGRIRMTDEGAALLEQLLRDKRREQLRYRRATIDGHGNPAIYNERIKVADQLLEEIERTQVEMGWLGGEPQRSQP